MTKGNSRSQLTQLRSPLVYFGLLLLTQETTFGGFLLRGGLTERVTILAMCWMGVVFVVSLVCVTFLTYNRPHNIVVEAQSNALSELQSRNRRIRRALALMLEYRAAETKDPIALLGVLDAIEDVLTKPLEEYDEPKKKRARATTS